MDFLYLAGALIFTSTGQLLYKYYHKLNNKIYLALTIVSFLLVPVFSYNALKELAIDTVYMSTSITIVMVLLGGAFLLKEKLSKRKIIGSVIIIIGVIIYNV
jgi:multidrug transporter EmrE-like cation transporter